MEPFFRAGRGMGASESAGGSAATARTPAVPALRGVPSGGGEGSGTAGFIRRASQVRLNHWLRRHGVRDIWRRLADVRLCRPPYIPPSAEGRTTAGGAAGRYGGGGR